jgi:hypothetical protein
MTWLTIIGTIVTLFGIAGLGYCVKIAISFRTKKIDDNETVAQLKRLVPINLGSVCIAALGLMMVVVSFLI